MPRPSFAHTTIDGMLVRAGADKSVALSGVAPEIDAASVRPEVPLPDQVDLDSIDYLNFMIAIHAAQRRGHPRSGLRELGTVNDTVAYLARQMASRSG